MPDNQQNNTHKPTGARAPIGVFDSGYGGLTILKAIRSVLPEYDYLYLGDNARAPYGTRSFDVVYRYTLQAVRYLFDCGCPLVILGCNTASAKALRTIQQNDLPKMADPTRRVLGVIRPTVESFGSISAKGHVGVLATQGTVASRSYDIETAKLLPGYTVTSHACPMWVPLVEYGEADGDGADYFVERDIKRLLSADSELDTIVLACTHYPLLIDKIRRYTPDNIRIVTQGEIVAQSLADYLRRHHEMQSRLSQQGTTTYLTTESADRFAPLASYFIGESIEATTVEL